MHAHKCTETNNAPAVNLIGLSLRTWLILVLANNVSSHGVDRARNHARYGAYTIEPDGIVDVMDKACHNRGTFEHSRFSDRPRLQPRQDQS